MVSSRQAQEALLRTDEEFRRLTEQHEELDSRLSKLSRQLYRTSNEELEKSTLKKRKLQLKDRMEDILRRRFSPEAEMNSPNVANAHARLIRGPPTAPKARLGLSATGSMKSTDRVSVHCGRILGRRGAVVLGLPRWALPLAILAGFLTFFFRDPERNVPERPEAVVAPADGRVVHAGEAEAGVAPRGSWKQVSVFLSPLDVHVNGLRSVGQ